MTHKLFATVLGVIFGILSAGSVGIPPQRNFVKQPVRETGNQFRQYFRSEPIGQTPLRSMSKESAATNEVTVRLTFDEETYESYGVVRVIGENGFRDAVFTDEGSEPNTGTIELPDGKYLFFSEFGVNDSTLFLANRNAWIVRECEITSDATIALDAEEAKNDITFSPVTPSGESPVLPTTHYSPNFPDGPENIAGNVSYISICSVLYSKSFGYIFGRTTEANFGVLNEYSGTSFNVFDVAKIILNDVSDDIYVVQTTSCSAQDGFYVATMKPIFGVSEDIEAEYSKEYDNILRPEFETSCLAESATDIFTPFYGFATDILTTGENVNIQNGKGITSSDGLLQIADNPEYKIDGLEYRFKMSYSGYGEPAYDDEGEIIGTMAYSIDAQPLRIVKEGYEVEVEQLLPKYTIQSDGSDYIPIAGHPAFSYRLEDSTNYPGNSQPSVVLSSFKDYDYEEETWSWYVDNLPVGRVGEFVIPDLITAERSERELENGQIEFTANVSNRMIDGIRGTTSATMCVRPESDVCPPALQMLQFRNGEEKVTDRFVSGDEPIIRMAVGQFSQKFDTADEYEWWFAVAPLADLTVEVAPIGTDNWIAVEMMEIPEWYVPEFGYLFEGRLTEFTNDSYKGWYDLRVSMTDESGNTLREKISPAFKVGETSRVNEVVNTAADIYVVGNDIIAPEDAEVYTLSGASCGKVSLSSGIYLVRHSDRVVKVMVK